METKQLSSQFENDFAHSDVVCRKATYEEDVHQGIDIWLNDIPFAWRKRRISVTDHKQISIRASRSSGSKTEYQKLLDGDCKAMFYVFEFTDAIVICRVLDIVKCLRNEQFETQENPDGETSAMYIGLRDVKHLLVNYEREPWVRQTEQWEWF